jgi:UDP-N-acetylmuramate dehydrogenase
MIALLDAPTLTGMIGAPVRAREPLARHNSWRVGGPADWFVVAKTLEVFRRAVLVARAQRMPYLILGRGTNVLIADAGVRALVIAEACDEFRLMEHGDSATLGAEAGASLPQLANALARRGWAGLEWAVGIPSAIGSAVVNNAGAHGACIADVLQRATILDEHGDERVLELDQMEYTYRHSRFKGEHLRGEVVLAAEFRLKRDTPEAVTARLRKFNEHRRATQPSDPSAGSVFQNPPGDYAGRLIDAAGLKGTQIGGARISPVHANFFVNTGAATAADLLALIRLAQAAVREKFGIELQPEIEFIGEWNVGDR